MVRPFERFCSSEASLTRCASPPDSVVAGLYGGAIADRHDRRRVALASSAVMWLTTVGVAAQAWAGLESVPAANALNMMTFSVALMVGPMLGGVLVGTVGYAWTYSIDVVTCLAALYAVWRLPSLPPQRGEAAPASGRPRTWA